MPRTVLITGATGTVSTAVLDALRGSELDLRAMVRHPAAAHRLDGRAAVVTGDLGHPASLPSALEGVQDLWLLVPDGPRTPEHAMNAIWAARRTGVERVVRLSVVGADDRAPTRGGRLHAMADRVLQESGLRWTILRPHWFMQNLLNEAGAIAARGTLSLAMGAGRLSMIDVADIAASAATVLADATDRHDGKTYTLTGPRPVSLADVAASLTSARGTAVEYAAVSPATRRATLLGYGVPTWIADMIIEWEDVNATGWGDFTTTDVADLVGRSPRDVADFARDHAAAFAGEAQR